MSTENTITLEDSSYKLEGKIFPYKAELSINGEKVMTSDTGTFTTSVQLIEGENSINISAKDGDKLTEKSYKIKRLSAAEIAEKKRIAKEKSDADAQAQANKANDAKKKSQALAKSRADAEAKAKSDAIAKEAKQKADAAAKAAQQKAVASKPQPTKSTMDKLWEASDSVVRTRKGVDIKFDPNIGTAQLFVTDGSEWNEKFLVQRTYNRFVLWGQKVNSFSGVQTIDVQTKTGFVDSYGNNTTDTSVRTSMDVGKFRNYNWNNLEATPIHTQIRADGTLYLQPSIKSKVNLEEAKLFL
ncbi:MAG: hypothetical protein ABIR46_00035 [Candidatus Saccharimonadales bacterium]